MFAKIYQPIQLEFTKTFPIIGFLQSQYSNKQWAEDLKEYGVVDHKSPYTYIPLKYLKTSEEEAAIMRGIFDGDGTLSYGRYKGKYKDSFYIVFGISGSKKLCSDYAFLLKKNLGIDCEVYTKPHSYAIQVRTIDKTRKVFNFLYGHENFYIKRKKERFEKLLNGTFTKETDPYYVN